MSSDNRTEQEVAEELDRLEEEYRTVPENRQIIGRGPEAIREHLRMAAEAKKQLTIRLDADIIERFKELAGVDGSYQTLINRALQEWLEGKSINALIEPQIKRLERAIAYQDRRGFMLQDQDPDDGAHPRTLH